LMRGKTQYTRGDAREIFSKSKKHTIRWGITQPKNRGREPPTQVCDKSSKLHPEGRG